MPIRIASAKAALAWSSCTSRSLIISPRTVAFRVVPPRPRSQPPFFPRAMSSSSTTTGGTDTPGSAAGSPARAGPSTSPLPGNTPSTTSGSGQGAAPASTESTSTSTSAPHTQPVTEDNGNGAISPLTKPLPLPAPDSDSATTTQIHVNGQAVALDSLGPMVVGRDGTLSRIGNWGEMTALERENTLRVLGRRNQLRLGNLKAGREADAKVE